MGRYKDGNALPVVGLFEDGNGNLYCAFKTSPSESTVYGQKLFLYKSDPSNILNGTDYVEIGGHTFRIRKPDIELDDVSNYQLGQTHEYFLNSKYHDYYLVYAIAYEPPSGGVYSYYRWTRKCSSYKFCDGTVPELEYDPYTNKVTFGATSFTGRNYLHFHRQGYENSARITDEDTLNQWLLCCLYNEEYAVGMENVQGGPIRKAYYNDVGNSEFHRWKENSTPYKVKFIDQYGDDGDVAEAVTNVIGDLNAVFAKTDSNIQFQKVTSGSYDIGITYKYAEGSPDYYPGGEVWPYPNSGPYTSATIEIYSTHQEYTGAYAIVLEEMFNGLGSGYDQGEYFEGTLTTLNGEFHANLHPTNIPGGGIPTRDQNIIKLTYMDELENGMSDFEATCIVNPPRGVWRLSTSATRSQMTYYIDGMINQSDPDIDYIFEIAPWHVSSGGYFTPYDYEWRSTAPVFELNSFKNNIVTLKIGFGTARKVRVILREGDINDAGQRVLFDEWISKSDVNRTTNLYSIGVAINEDRRYTVNVGYCTYVDSNGARGSTYVGAISFTNAVHPPLWDWNTSNGDATKEETQLYYEILRGRKAAVTVNENLQITASYIPYKVWNDMCDKVMEMREFFGKDWNSLYLTLAKTKMTSSDKKLSAARLNSLKYNVGQIHSTGIADVSSGNTVKGKDQITIMEKCNEKMQM